MKDFYPTPRKLMEQIFDGVDWKKVKVVLEPSAGKGDMAQFVLEQMEKNYCYEPDLDCIEIEPELRNTLTGAGFRVVHDDFITFQTYKRYDRDEPALQPWSGTSDEGVGPDGEWREHHLHPECGNAAKSLYEPAKSSGRKIRGISGVHHLYAGSIPAV